MGFSLIYSKIIVNFTAKNLYISTWKGKNCFCLMPTA